MTLLSLVLISTGCEERIDSPAVNPSEEKMIEVTLNIGFAEEIDAASFFPTPFGRMQRRHFPTSGNRGFM